MQTLFVTIIKTSGRKPFYFYVNSVGSYLLISSLSLLFPRGFDKTLVFSYGRSYLNLLRVSYKCSDSRTF